MATCQSCGKYYDHREARTEMFQCIDCEAYSEDDDGPLYECGSCGNVYTRESTEGGNHICPQCHRFGMKLAEAGCPSCQQGELIIATVTRCPHCEAVEDIV